MTFNFSFNVCWPIYKSKNLSVVVYKIRMYVCCQEKKVVCLYETRDGTM